MMKKIAREFSLVCVLCLIPITILAQSQATSADMTGTIYDQTKAPVRQATVTAVNLDTMILRTATSGADGVYRIPLLPPGRYEVQVKAAGFNLQVKQGITLTVGQTAVINFGLLVGIKMETEVIETVSPLIDIERTHQASTITQRPINNLPINGRNYTDFAKLTPGVVEESPTVIQSQIPQLPTSGLSFGGQNGRANSVLIDGLNTNDIASDGVRPTISQEAVREFQINGAGYNAEFGRASAGTINIVSKSGSSEFHGNFYNYFRNEWLDARNIFAPTNSQDPPFKRNQPGFSLGGPIHWDQTFFFLSSEGLIRRESTFTTILSDPSVLNPTAGQQNLINTLINSGNADQAMIGRNLQAVLTTSPNNPQAAAQQVLQQPFAQNPSTFSLLSSSNGAFPLSQSSSTSSLRIDHAFRDRDSLFLRAAFTNDARHNVGIGGLSGPSSGFDLAIIDQGIVLGENHLFRNGDSNEFRFQLSRNVFNVHPVDPFGPQYKLSGVGTFGRDLASPADRRQYREEAVDNYSFKRGRHNFKIGGDFNNYSFKTLASFLSGGQIGFIPAPIPLGAVLNPTALNTLTAVLNGNLGRPDLLRVLEQPLTVVQQVNFGLASVVTQAFGNPNLNLGGQNLGIYAQDGLQLKPNLHLNFGFRYDYAFQVAGTPRDGNNFGPRIGFAYDPFKTGRTVIRGSGGVYYQPILAATSFISRLVGSGQTGNVFVAADQVLTQANPGTRCGQSPFPSFCFYQSLVSSGLVSFSSTGTIPQSAYLNLLGMTPGASNNRFVVRVQDRLVNPYSIQGNFGIDHLLGRDLLLSVNYLVNHGVKLLRSRQANATPNPNQLDAFGRPSLAGRIDPTRLVDFVYESSGNSIYHGLAVSVNKRFSRYYQLIGSYTFSKTIDDTTDINFEQGPQDPTNVRAERSLSSFDVRHRLSLASLFESPFRGGAGHSFYERIMTDFYLSPIITLRSGFPFNVITGLDINGDNNFNDRPFGVGRNTGLGPGFFSTDLRVGRRFPLGVDKPRSIEAIFDAFNLFNRVNYRDVNNNTGGIIYLDQAGFSDVRFTGCSNKAANAFCGFSSSYDSRVIQLGVKVSF